MTIFACILLYDPPRPPVRTWSFTVTIYLSYVACTRRHPPLRLSILFMLARDETLIRSGYVTSSKVICLLSLSHVFLFNTLLAHLLSVFFVARSRNGIAIFPCYIHVSHIIMLCYSSLWED